MLLLDVLAANAASHGDRTLLLHEGRRITYGELDRLSNRAAHALTALGVAKGDRVTLALGSSVEWVAAAFGALKAGAVLHPINPALGAAELGYVLAHAAPRLILADGAAAERLSTAAPPGASVAPVGDFAAAMDRASESRPAVHLGPDDPSTLLYTSGTTGNPKGVLMNHGTTGAASRLFIDALGIGEGDTLLAVTPLFHGNAWGAVQTAMTAGGRVAFPAAFRASEFWPLARESGATVLFTLATILAILLTREPSELERRTALRVILGLGSAPLRERVIERFGVAHVAECYGSTDAGVVTITPLGAAPRPGSCGPAVPGVTVEIRDESGGVLGPRRVGEIAVLSPYRMAEYFRDPEATRRAIRDGWFLTGDLGYLDEDGWLHFVDRKKDVVRRGGENVSSVMVEKTLREHPAVAEAAVIGVPDPILGEELKAFVVAKSPVTVDELRVFAAARLAKFQVPRFWEFRDALPKTATQRVEKHKLR